MPWVEKEDETEHLGGRVTYLIPRSHLFRQVLDLAGGRAGVVVLRVQQATREGQPRTQLLDPLVDRVQGCRGSIRGNGR